LIDQEARSLARKEIELGSIDKQLFSECLETAQGNEKRAQAIYLHRRSAELARDCVDQDRREKWPMLAPLLVLYTLGTIGVLLLVFGFLAGRLGWW